MMGYISRDIAIITQPDVLTLSALPNFVQFASKPAVKTLLRLSITVHVNASTPGDIPDMTLLEITDHTGKTLRTLNGTTVVEDAGGSVFFVAADTADTAENIRRALLVDKWFAANFDITIPFTWQGGTTVNGSVIHIASKGAGTDYNIRIAAKDSTAFTVSGVNPVSSNNDSISGEASSVGIELDVYVDPAVRLGQDDRPVSPPVMGTYAITLHKTYAGSPVWFELNALFSQYGAYNRPPDASTWFDTGTLRAYRFTAKVRGVNSFYFYQSGALFVLHGHGRVFDELDMSEYVYAGEAVRLLTNKPRTPYVRGQREYLNFVLSYPSEDYTLRIFYRAYSTSGVLLGTSYGQPVRAAALATVNTCVLDIDTVLEDHPTAGVVRVALARGEEIISNDLEYTVRPECLHALRQFSFINRLGGWDAVNFDAGVRDDIKPRVETYNRTVTPSHRKGDSVETVYDNTLTNTFTVEGSPVSDEVAAWLKELAAARVILDGEGRYIIIEDFTLQVTGGNKNMHRPVIKYRISQ